MKEDQVVKAINDLSKNLGKWMAAQAEALKEIKQAILDRDAVDRATDKLDAAVKANQPK